MKKYVGKGALTHFLNKIKTLINVYLKDGGITPTNEFLGDKRIYRKMFWTTQSINYDNNYLIKVPHGITNYEYLWIDMSNSYAFANKNDPNNYVCVPIVATAYVSNSESELSATILGENILIISNTGWGVGWMKIVTIKFTYKD